MTSLADEQYLREVKLDRAQRARAELICGEVNENPIMAAFELIYLRDREKLLLDAHTGCGCEPTCAVCREKGFT